MSAAVASLRASYQCQPPTLQIASLAAVIMLTAASSLGVLLLFVTGELGFFQPSETPGPRNAFSYPTNSHPDAAIAYFTLDTAFVISFTLVFVGLYAFTRERARPYAAFALAAGVFTGVTDAIENAIYWSYAMQAHAGVALEDVDVRLLSVLTNLKLVGFFATYLTFALLFPRRSRLELAALCLMTLPPTLGLLSMGVRDLADLRPLLFSSPALPLAFVFATRQPPKPETRKARLSGPSLYSGGRI